MKNISTISLEITTFLFYYIIMLIRLSLILLSNSVTKRLILRGSPLRGYVDTKSRQNNSICVNHSSHIPQRVEKKTLWFIVSMYTVSFSICRNVETKSFYVPLPLWRTVNLFFSRSQ